MGWLLFGLFVTAAVWIGIASGMATNRAKEAYQASLAALTSDPRNTALRQATLALGRAYAARVRNGKGVSVFDEVALMNDINAACGS